MKKILISTLFGLGALMPAMVFANSTSVTATAPAAVKLTAAETRGNTEVDVRVTRLNDVSSRIQSVQLISADQKTAFAASLQAEIAQLTALKSEIDSATSTVSLKAEVQSITKSYRVYMLVVPQTDIVVQADRVNTIVGLMQTLGAKLSTRIVAAGSPSNLTALLSDYNAKVSDAAAQAGAAVAEVVNLAPDNGNSTVQASNNAALKDARAKLEVARKDIVAARKDAGQIAADLKASATATTTAQ